MRKAKESGMIFTPFQNIYKIGIMASVEEEGVAGSGASHGRYDAIGHWTLCVGVMFLAEVNFGLCVHYIGAGKGGHCPLD
jgi:hypothetical protein